MARRYLLIAMIAATGCGKGDGTAPRGDESATSDRAPVDPMGLRGAVIRSCLAALVEIADQLRDTTTFAAPDPDLKARVVCADLYRGDCADAWRTLGRQPTGFADVLPACARTYCAELPAPAPEACRAGRRGDDAELLARLDAAIHVRQGSSREEAEAMARRIRLFAPITAYRHPGVVDLAIGSAVPIDQPGPPGQPTFIPHPVLRVFLGKDALEVNGEPATLAEIEARVRAQVAADPDARFIVASDGDVPHGRVVAAMEAIKNGGGKNIALEVVPP